MFSRSLAVIIILFSFSLSYSQSNKLPAAVDQKSEIKKITSGPALTKAELSAIARNISSNLNIDTSVSLSTTLRNAFIYSGLKQQSSGGITATIINTDWDITWNSQNGTPVSINFKTPPVKLSKKSPVAAVFIDQTMQFLDANKTFFRLAQPSEELRCTESYADNSGKNHLRFSQYYNSIPVWKSDIIIHYDANANLYALNARYAPTPDLTGKSFSIDSLKAISIAVSKLNTFSKLDSIDAGFKKILVYNGPTANKYIWINRAQKPNFCWVVDIRSGIKDQWIFFVDAQSGIILQYYNTTNFDNPCTASAVDLNNVTQLLHVYYTNYLYCMVDASRPMWNAVQPDIFNNPQGAIWTLDLKNQDPYYSNLINVLSLDNTWSDKIAVSAHNNAGIVFDYYYKRFNRLGLDGAGTTISSIIHYPDGSGGPLDNAFWNGYFVCYGDGNIYKPFAGGLDVAAHEMTHGVVQNTVDLIYQYQSGALNESFADIFAAMIDTANWLIGEGVCYSGAFRSMENPGKFGQPSNMNEYFNCDLSFDQGGVHYNSGIPNHACYLIASKIGRVKTEKIFYRILDAKYLNPQSQFIDLRVAALRSAVELFGNGSAEYIAVKNGFDNVGIVADTMAPIDPPKPGTQWIAAVNCSGNDRNLYVAKPLSASPSDKILLSNTQVNNSSSPLSVASDGGKLFFVDSSHNIRCIGYDGKSESVVDKRGIWHSIAISPDSKYLAASTIFRDTLLYILDLKNPDKSTFFKLSSILNNSDSSSIIYADALDWDKGGRFLTFDAFHMKGTETFWNIYIFDMKTGELFSIFPHPSTGISYADPHFSRVKPGYIVYDSMNYNTFRDDIRVCNYLKKISGLIEQNGSSIGFPSFSPDDSFIVFQRVNTIPGLRYVKISGSYMSSLSQSDAGESGLTMPVWFTISTTDIAGRKSEHGKNIFSRLANYPNPFHNETSLQYSLAKDASVQLSIYDMGGKKIADIHCGKAAAGSYSYIWHGCDQTGKQLPGGVYIVRLNAVNDYSKSTLSHRIILVK
jgi:bacillolysin